MPIPNPKTFSALSIGSPPRNKSEFNSMFNMCFFRRSLSYLTSFSFVINIKTKPSIITSVNISDRNSYTIFKYN